MIIMKPKPNPLIIDYCGNFQILDPLMHNIRPEPHYKSTISISISLYTILCQNLIDMKIIYVVTSDGTLHCIDEDEEAVKQVQCSGSFPGLHP